MTRNSRFSGGGNENLAESLPGTAATHVVTLPKLTRSLVKHVYVAVEFAGRDLVRINLAEFQERVEEIVSG